MLIVKAGAVCFALVFGTGFVLGMIRVPLLVPRLGVQIAELIEMPFLCVAIVLAARHIVRRCDLAPGAATRLPVGLMALGITVIAVTLACGVDTGAVGRRLHPEPGPGVRSGVSRDAGAVRADAVDSCARTRRSLGETTGTETSLPIDPEMDEKHPVSGADTRLSV